MNGRQFVQQQNLNYGGCRKQLHTSILTWAVPCILVVVLYALSNVVLNFKDGNPVSLSQTVAHKVDSRPDPKALSSSTLENTTIPTTQTGISTIPDRLAGVVQASNATPKASIRNTTFMSINTTVRYIHRLILSNTSSDGSSVYDSLRLLYASDPDQRDAWWVVETFGNIVEQVNASFHRRMNVMAGKLKNGNDVNNNNSIFPSPALHDEWKVFLMDYLDMPSMYYIHDIMNKIATLIGKERVYLVTRGTTAHRNMKNQFNLHGNYRRGMSGRALGYRVNMTSSFGDVCAGVKRFHFTVRDDVLDALNEGLIAYGNESGISASTDPVDIPRPKDAAHFWNAAILRKSFLRSRVSLTLQQMQESNKNLTMFADFVGMRGKPGRHGVHPDYVRALLEFKIIVVCQRDRYEDHYRLFEAMISGALVMSDPALAFPWGVVDGETIVVYRDLTDLQDKIMYYLSHKDERLRIARASRILALNHHRGHHRYEDLILGDWTAKDEYGVSLLSP